MAFVFVGRLGLGNEDDFAAPQKVKVADLMDKNLNKLMLFCASILCSCQLTI